MPARAPGPAGAGPGRFVRLFPRRRNPLPVRVLHALAATMDEGMSQRLEPSQAAVPAAGFTYLGQFVDHDLTFDDRRFGARRPAGEPPNLRTPRFDLDSLYGRGPAGDAVLFDGDRLRLGPGGTDLPRHADGSALVADRRNDSNRILSQLHVAFARFHNAVVASLPSGRSRFDAARMLVRRHYQWIVLHELLPTLVGPALVDTLRAAPLAGQGLKLFVPGRDAAMPHEFAAAAYRFGHSMVRSGYRLNDGSSELLVFDTARPTDPAADDLRGFRPLPRHLAIDWALFFALPGSDRVPQQARPIDTWLTGPLFALPVAVAESDSAAGRLLAFRNLHRGEVDLGLPSGEQVARELRRRGAPGTEQPLLGIEVPVTVAGDGDFGGTGIGKEELERALTAGTPLWYYVLKEAEQWHAGVQLGPVGSRLVAEVVVGLMASDPHSVLTSGWRPRAGEFGCPRDGHYGIGDLLAYVGR